MSGEAQLQVQKALYDASVAALSPAKVYDHVPQKSPFPYAVLGDAEVAEWDTDTELGQEHHAEIHTFSRDPARGRKAIKDMQKKLYDALHTQPLTLQSGAALLFCYFVSSIAVLDPDGVTYHGISRFRIVTTEA